MLELFLGQIPEAIYFALFMIFAKDLKEKRFLFIILMITEYLLLLNIFPYNIWFHLSQFMMTYILLKILYKEKCQVTDIFILAIASVILIAICAALYFIIWSTINNYLIYAILTRICMFLIIILFRKKLNKIQNLYKIIWNRNDKLRKNIKTTTFRALNLVIFNIMFYAINIGMIFILIQKGGV